MSGFIALHRKILDWSWYADPLTKVVFLHLLLTASFKPTKWRGVTIERGQCTHGRKEMAEALGISEQNVRTALDKLKSTNEITITSTSKFSLITVVNYEKYQDKNATATSASTSSLTNDQPATNQQLTTTKQVNNTNNTNKEEISAHARELFERYGKVSRYLLRQRIMSDEFRTITSRENISLIYPNEGCFPPEEMSMEELSYLYPDEPLFRARQ